MTDPVQHHLGDRSTALDRFIARFVIDRLGQAMERPRHVRCRCAGKTEAAGRLDLFRRKRQSRVDLLGGLSLDLLRGAFSARRFDQVERQRVGQGDLEWLPVAIAGQPAGQAHRPVGAETRNRRRRRKRRRQADQSERDQPPAAQGPERPAEAAHEDFSWSPERMSSTFSLGPSAITRPPSSTISRSTMASIALR